MPIFIAVTAHKILFGSQNRMKLDSVETWEVWRKMVLVWIPEGKRLLRRPKRKWKYNIK